MAGNDNYTFYSEKQDFELLKAGYEGREIHVAVNIPDSNGNIDQLSIVTPLGSEALNLQKIELNNKPVERLSFEKIHEDCYEITVVF